MSGAHNGNRGGAVSFTGGPASHLQEGGDDDGNDDY